ncbi:MAG: TIGR02594 family protein [Gammaproteobacteria bacterium]
MTNSDADPKHLTIARELLGTKEIAGAKDNPVIMAMYGQLGHKWVEHDEVPWCAAFVGACLERGGVRSTRSLAARSYMKWGKAVVESDARPGDVAVFSRGKNPAEGHVAFFLGWAGDRVEVLGGNQRDAVTVTTYPHVRLLGIRRAPAADRRAEPDDAVAVAPPPQPSPTRGEGALLRMGSRGVAVEILQQRLDELGYQVGYIDGSFGARTRAAVLAFQADNDIETDGIAGPVTLEAIDRGKRRPISVQRAEANLAGLAKESRIADASLKNVAAGGGVAVGGAVGMAGQVADTVGQIGDWLRPVRWFVAEYGLAVCAVAVAIGAYIAWQAWKAGQARVDDERRGKTS